MRARMMPNGQYAKSDDEYAEAWSAMGQALEKVFDGYTFASCNPGFCLEKRLVNQEENTYRVLDRVNLSVDAAAVLLKKLQISY